MQMQVYLILLLLKHPVFRDDHSILLNIIYYVSFVREQFFIFQM